MNFYYGSWLQVLFTDNNFSKVFWQKWKTYSLDEPEIHGI